MSEKRRGEVRKKIWKNTEETGFWFSPDGILHCEEPAVSFFEENPKNLLAALKIAAKSGAVLREDVERAVFQCFHNIVRLSGKDVLDELSPLICGACADSILDRYRDVFACVIPELAPMFDLDQHSPYHNRDVWHHTLAGVADIPPVFELRMTMLLHDIAKPVVFLLDDNGRGRFVGHPEKGAEMAYRILRRMEVPKDKIEKIVRLVRYHDVKIRPETEDVRKVLAVFGREGFEELLLVRHADASGKYSRYLSEAEDKNAWLRACAERIVESGDYFSPKRLKIGLRELSETGISDELDLWRIRDRLLAAAAGGELENEKSALLRAAKESKK